MKYKIKESKNIYQVSVFYQKQKKILSESRNTATFTELVFSNEITSHLVPIIYPMNQFTFLFPISEMRNMK